MKDDPIEIVRGSGNAYRDFEDADADIKQLKAILAAAIIKELDTQGLTMRQAHAQTGYAAADFSRIRKANLDRFSIDRLMGMLNGLGARVDVRVNIRKTTTSLNPQP